MANHRNKRENLLVRMTRKQATVVAASFLSIGLLLTGGVASVQMYQSATAKPSASPITAYSATDVNSADLYQAVSRGEIRTALTQGRGGSDDKTTYVKVIEAGQTKLVFGSKFSTVKSVLEQGNITLQPGDTVSPALKTKVSESTVITINRANSKVKTSLTPIAFNTIEKQTDSLLKGQTKVETEGQDGQMETTDLIQVAGGKLISSSTLVSWVKKAPVDKVVLVGTGTATSVAPSSPATRKATTPTAPNYGTTAPVGDSQAIAHQMVLARGWSESDFTCLVQLWNRESGWRTNAYNPSGAYGIPQALPGSKMASAGADWQTNPATQISWGLGYIAGRYGTPCGAWSHSQATGWY